MDFRSGVQGSLGGHTLYRDGNQSEIFLKSHSVCPSEAPSEAHGAAAIYAQIWLASWPEFHRYHRLPGYSSLAIQESVCPCELCELFSADIRKGDTLRYPQHTRGGELGFFNL
jgi:hypothetical protein